MRIDAIAGESHHHAPPRSTATVRRAESFQDTLERQTAANQSARAQTLYTVQTSDTLSHIVQHNLHRAGAPVSAAAIYQGVETIARSNGIANPDFILPGQTLDLSALNTTADRPVHVSTLAPPPAREITQPPPEPTPAQSSAIAPAPPLRPSQNTTAAANWPPAPPLPRTATPLLDENIPPTRPAPPIRPVFEGYDETAPPSMAFNIDEARLPAFRPEATSERLPVQSPWRRILDGRARLTSEFGLRNDPITGEHAHHNGIDLAAARGTAVRPYREGDVIASEFHDTYGNVVIIRHDDGLETLYAHNAANLVSVGDRVTPATTIATVGATGRSTAPHLHFEVRRNGERINPIPHLTRSGRHGAISSAGR